MRHSNAMWSPCSHLNWALTRVPLASTRLPGSSSSERVAKYQQSYLDLVLTHVEVFKTSEDDVEGSKVWLLPRLVSCAIVGLGKRIKWSDFRGEAASNLHPPPFFHKISIFPPILPRNRFKSTGTWHTNGKQLVFDANVFSLLEKNQRS